MLGAASSPTYADRSAVGVSRLLRLLDNDDRVPIVSRAKHLRRNARMPGRPPNTTAFVRLRGSSPTPGEHAGTIRSSDGMFRNGPAPVPGSETREGEPP